MPGSAAYVYRVGLYGIPNVHSRYIFSETWVSNDPEISDVNTRFALANIATRYELVFGFFPPFNLAGRCRALLERLYPTTKLLFPLDWVTVTGPPQLNPGAPEAAVRLQRVGAGGRLGRICIPLYDDSLYLDIPQRRRIDAALLNSRLPFGLGAANLNPSIGGRSYQCAIVDRRTKQYDPVTSYRVLPNPVRIWERWRPYDKVRYQLLDASFVPTEMFNSRS